MYSTRSGLIFGFHGCDETVALDVVNRRINLRESHNNYDWLGHGAYFWENSPERLDAQISSIIWDIKGFIITFAGLKTIDI